jgi:hypothetical protein
VNTETGEGLERYDAAQLEQMYGLTEGTPFAFAIDLDLVVLRPIPNSVVTYTHFYVRVEKTLTSDLESFYLPAQYHGAVLALAEAHVHETGRNMERAEAARERYNKVWRTRMLDDSTRARGPLRVRIRPGSAF